MKFFSRSLMARLIVSFLLLSFGAVSGIGALAYFRAREALTQSVYDQLQSLVAIKSDELNNWSDERRRELDFIASLPELRARADDLLQRPTTDAEQHAAAQAVAAFLAQALRNNPSFQEIFILTYAEGRVIVSTMPEREGDYQVRERYFTQGRFNPVWQGVYLSPATGLPVMTLALPLLNAHDEKVGVLAAHLNLDRINRLALSSLHLGHTSEIYLVDRYNTLISGDLSGQASFPRGLHSDGINAAIRGESGAALYTNYAGAPVVGVYQWVPGWEVALIAEVQQVEAFAPAQRLAQEIFGLGFVFVALMVGVVYWQARAIARPIEALTLAARKVTAGNLNTNVPIATQDELGMLGRAFNLMTLRLRQTLDGLEQEVAERKHAEAEAHQRADELEALVNVSTALRGLTSRADLSPLILDQLEQLLQAPGTALALRDPQSGHIFVELARGVWSNWNGLQLSAGEGITGQVIATGQPYLNANVHEDPRFLYPELIGELPAVACIPLMAQQQTLGAVWIGRATLLTNAEMQLVVAIANIAANTLYRLRLMELLEQGVAERTRELAQRVKQLDLINQVGRYATFMLDLDALLPDLAGLMRATFDYYAVLIFKTDPKSRTAHLGGTATADPMDMVSLLERDLNLPFGEGLIGHVAETSEAVVINDLAKQSSLVFAERLPRARSELTLPLRVGDQVLGVLDLESLQPQAFQEEDVRVLQTLADQIAVAMHNAELFRAAQAARATAEGAKGEAEEANRLKSQFLTSMSHELRTPLNSIINFAYLMSLGTEGEVSPGQEDLLNRIGEAGRHLLGLINDILDIAKIEAGKLELFLEELDLHNLMDSVLPTISGLLGDKPIELLQEIPARLPQVQADRKRISQVLLNLLSNAVKFTQTGQIIVRVTTQAEEIVVCVEDTGKGISPDDLPKVFAEFVQLDGDMSRQAGGAGLGLPISQKLVELHGGRMWAESQPGTGSKFYFSLPAIPEVVPPPPATLAPLPELIEVRVLVVDDDPISRKMISGLLAEMGGYRVIKVHDASRAVDLVRECVPDVILLDILMPVTDGWEVLKALKSTPETSHIPVVVCSVLREERQALSLAANDYLPKPVERRELRRVIERFTVPGGKVMVIDDDLDTLEIVRRMLDGVSYTVTAEKEGRAGLALARNQTPDIMILDLLMPDITGFEILSQLRAETRTTTLPVVVLSGEDLSEAEAANLHQHDSTFLRKGHFTAEEFATTVRRALQKNGR